LANVSVIQSIIEKDERKNTNSSNNKTLYKQAIHFLICDSCFWCASCIRLDVTVAKCPSCSDGKVEWMPITDNEIYKFNYDPKNGGVVLEFSPKPRERIT
jgi:hypothetical protein